MRNIQVISVNHQTHSSEERISLNLNEGEWEQLFAYLTFNLNVEGFVLLRTCNRIEIYYESEIDHRERIIDKWLSFSLLESTFNRDAFQVFNGYKDCIEHFLQLSAGFKSAIYGDDQILSQLKKAFEEARERKTMSTLLERAYQSIMRFHKKVCKETDYKSQTVSLAYQALKSAKNRFGSEKLTKKNLLIIGAGDMAVQVVKYLPKFSFKRVSITNRTRSKAELLSDKTSLLVEDYEAVDIQKYDLIVSCTDQGHGLINDWSTIEYYIDLSLYSAKLNDIPAPKILLDDLQKLINKQNAERMNSIEKVYQILTEKANEYIDWCSQWQFRMNDKKSYVQPID